VTAFAVSSHREDSGATVLELVGDLDVAAAPAMLAAGLAALDEPGCTSVTLDVAGVEFIDSTGIGTWIELRNRATGQGQTVRLRAVSASVARILEMGGLAGLFGPDERPSAEAND
jgi:anti-anti-sigma factor